MKRLFTLSALIFLVSFVAAAIPAHRELFRYRQPDGTLLLLQNHGDEFYHWTTDVSGIIVEKNADGFYHIADPVRHQARIREAYVQRRNAISFSPMIPVTGDRKVLCIIANFTDSTFVAENPNDRFSRMLNEPGYSDGGSIGSVRDYYIDNSMGQYRPQFDVYGPVTLSESSAYYDRKGVTIAIKEAYELLADQINPDDYDTDGDGAVDAVLFYYPGWSEASGGAPEAIWPHQAGGNFGYFGDKRFNRYCCVSEIDYSGRSAYVIGTTCHEFTHVLGLRDFYDTNSETNGYNYLEDRYDIMNYGNYNDRCRKPPYFNAMERILLGWMPTPGSLTDGHWSLPPIRNNVAYKIDSRTEGEYFLLECRDNYKWDSPLRNYGLLVYHVDQSSNIVGDSGKTAEKLWGTNGLNNYGGHPCFYLIGAIDTPYIPFPGKDNVDTLIPMCWDGSEANISLGGIIFDGSSISFDSVSFGSSLLFGCVSDEDGVPISGAQVILTQSAIRFAPPRHGLSRDIVQVTGSDGNYCFTIPDSAGPDQILTVTADGYVPVSLNSPIADRFTRHDFSLVQPELDFSTLGIASIQLTEGGIKVLAPADRTVYTTEWFLDGKAVTTPPLPSTLSSVAHTYMVRLTYYDGTVERVYLDVN